MAFVELPGVYLDEVAMDAASTGLVLINRNPTASESEVLVNEDIALDIASVTGNAVDTANTDIYVNINAAGEVLAVDGGVFQAGYTGPRSITSNPDTNTLRIVIDPTVPWNSLDSVQVRVVSQDVGATETIDTSYTFVVQDLTPATVTAASPQDLDVCRVSFDEAIVQADASDAHDGLNPSNYTFTPLTFPAVTPVATLVESVSATAVDVTTDIEFSPGKQYKVTVTGVSDLKGNLT
jgi:hypothetical protein